MKIHPVKAELFQGDGQTDMTKLVVAFRNFAKVPKKETRMGECMYVYICIYIQGVPGGMCQTSGECSLC